MPKRGFFTNVLICLAEAEAQLFVAQANVLKIILFINLNYINY